MNPSIANELSLNKRLASIVIDHLIMTLVCLITTFPSMVLVDNLSPFLTEPYDYVSLLGFAAYFCKDSVEGRSPGKRILKLQVVRKTTGQPVSPIRSLVRNLTCILWPIEIIASMLNPQRRIGDRIAGTMLVPVSEAPNVSKINFSRIAVTFVMIYCLIVSCILLLKHL